MVEYHFGIWFDQGGLFYPHIRLMVSVLIMMPSMSDENHKFSKYHNSINASFWVTTQAWFQHEVANMLDYTLKGCMSYTSVKFACNYHTISYHVKLFPNHMLLRMYYLNIIL